MTRRCRKPSKVFALTTIVIAGIVLSSSAAWALTSGDIYTEAGGPGTSSSSSAISISPNGIALEGGNLYLTDGASNAVRKLSGASFGTVTNLAGIGVSGYSGDGGLATLAQLSGPTGIAVDSSGNVYFSDTDNNVVRKINASTGDISTIAGNGTGGYSGDGGAATSAELDGPTALSLFSGNLYIADSQNSVIREVNLSTGDISTVAGNGTAGYSGDGGAATSAELNDPTGLAFDSSGDMYISDCGADVVREVGVSSGDISTIAGSGTSGYTGDGGPATSAQLDCPQGLAVDSSGDVFIADSGNSAVREVSSSSSDISTVAGNGTQGDSGIGGLATSAEIGSPQAIVLDSSGDIFIADSGDYEVWEVVASSGDIFSVAGNGYSSYSGDGASGTGAQLQNPSGVAMTSSGNVDFTDTQNNVVRQLNVSTGHVSTIAGTGVAGYSGDGGLATSAELNQPTGIFIDSSGNVYIADTGNNVIRKISASTGDISTVAGDGTAGYTGDGGAATSAELNGPQGVFVDSSGDMDIADTGNNVIRYVAASSGHITTFAGGPGSGTATSVSQIPDYVVVSSGDLYVADQDHNVVRKVVLSTGAESTVAGNGGQGYTGDGGLATAAQLNGPTAIAVDSSGDVYIADSGNNVIREVAASSGDISTIAGNGIAGYSGDGGLATAAELGGPEGVAVDSSGDVFISDTENDVIREVSASTGDISTIAGNGLPGYSGDGGAATSAEINSPQGISLSSGNLYIADTDNNVIRELNMSSGDISTVAGDGTAGYVGDGGPATSAELQSPTDVQFDGSGNMYIADSGNNVIREVSVSSGDISTVIGNGTGGYSGDGGAPTSAELDQPVSVAVDGSGNVYVADLSNDRIRMLTASSDAISTEAGNGYQSFSGAGGAATHAELLQPTDITFNGYGEMYIADSGNNVVWDIPFGGDIQLFAGNGTAGYSGDGGAATSAELNNPEALAYTGGNLYISDTDNNVIRYVSGGDISTVAGDGGAGGFSGDGGSATSASLFAPVGIAYDSHDNLWIADFGNSRIRVVSDGGAL